MPLYLATYDIRKDNPPAYAEFINQAKTLGWGDWVQTGQGVKKLPNTTLIGEFGTLSGAQAAFFQAASLCVAQGYPCYVEKWVLTEMAENTLNSDVTA